jgi:hypothetical protein
MKKVISTMLIVVILGTTMFMLAGCGKKETEDDLANIPLNTNTPEGRLAIVGLTVSSVKPEGYIGIENAKSSSKDTGVVIFMEQGIKEDTAEVRKPIFDKLYNAIAAISDDGKVYKTFYGHGEPTEISLPSANSEIVNWDGMLFSIQFSYQKDDKWITVTGETFTEKKKNDIDTMGYIDAPVYPVVNLDFVY